MQQIDISNALEKAVSYLENTEKDNAHITVKSDKPFALYMRFKKYIKAFIIKAADEDISIKLNSTYRNRAAQQSLISKYEVKYANWVAGGKQGKKPIKPAEYIYHIWAPLGWILLKKL